MNNFNKISMRNPAFEIAFRKAMNEQQLKECEHQTDGHWYQWADCSQRYQLCLKCKQKVNKQIWDINLAGFKDE